MVKITNEQRHEISNNVACATCKSLGYSMTVKLLTKHNLAFLSLKGGCTGSSECTIVKVPHCWKSHVMAQMYSHLKHAYTDVKWVHYLYLLCKFKYDL